MNEPENPVSEHLLTIGSVFIVLGVALTVAAPALFIWLSPSYDFSEKGNVGDTIAGITAPIVGLLGAVLIFLSLYAQIAANRIVLRQLEMERARYDREETVRQTEKDEADARYLLQQRNQNFAILLGLLKDRNQDINNFTFSDQSSSEPPKTGTDAISLLIENLRSGGEPKEAFLLYSNLLSISDLFELISIFDLTEQHRTVIGNEIVAIMMKVYVHIRDETPRDETVLGKIAKMIDDIDLKIDEFKMTG